MTTFYSRFPPSGGGSGGVTSINGDTTAAQIIAAGSGISVATIAGTTTITNTRVGTVTSVDVSGGTTGLSTSGGPITSSGTITIAGTVNVTHGGSGTTTQFTLGSVVFAGTSGVYSQDNSNFFWEDTNNRLGIGVNSSLTAKLNVITGATTELGVFVKAIAAQTANLLEFRNSSNAIMGGRAFNGVPFAYGGGAVTSNTAFGVLALANNSGGAGNVAYGASALGANTSGVNNLAVGTNALLLNTSGANNLAIGTGALTSNTTGQTNVAIGGSALNSNTTANANTAVGFQALFAGATGSNNVGIGANAGTNVGTHNLAIGEGASSALGSSNVEFTIAIGQNAVKFANDKYNIGIGSGALFGADSTATGTRNIAIGFGALSSYASMNYNVAIGESALSQAGIGDYNVGLGYQVLFNLNNGSGNVAIGKSAASSVSNEENNVAIGASSNCNGVNRAVALGYQATVELDDAIVFGDASNPAIQAAIGVTTPLGMFHIRGLDAAKIQLLVQGAESQSANLTEWWDNDANVVASMSSAGNLTVAGIDTGSGAVELAAGTYTPSLTNVANLSASTAYSCQYLRVGSNVTVSGRVDIDPVIAATSTQLGISLPIASALANTNECAGTAFASGIAAQGAAILADATNDRAQLQYVSSDITNQAMYFTFTYRII